MSVTRELVFTPGQVQQSHLTQRYQFGLENSLKVTSLEINVCQARLYLPPGALFMLIGENECLRMTLRKCKLNDCHWRKNRSKNYEGIGAPYECRGAFL